MPESDMNGEVDCKTADLAALAKSTGPITNMAAISVTIDVASIVGNRQRIRHV